MHILKFCRLGTVLASALSLAFFIGCGDGGGAAAPAGAVATSAAGTVSQLAASAPVTPAARPAVKPASRPVLQPVSRQAAAAKVEQTEKPVDKPLPPKDQMRALWNPPLRGVIYNWLVCGPFPVASSKSQPASMPTTDFLADSGGELAARPQAGQEVRRQDGTFTKWIEFTSKSDIVYLQEALPTVDIQPSVVYFAATVHLAGPGRKIIDLSSRDDIKVFWNGKEVGFLNNRKFVGRDDSLLPVEVKAGENLLLLRLYGSRDRRGFMCRIDDERSASLARKPDIAPAILPKDANAPNRLAVKSDVKKFGQNDVLLINVRGPAGKLMTSEAIVRGDTFTCDTADWTDGPYEVQMFYSDADGKAQIKYLNWHKGDYMPLVRRILDECDGLPADSSDPVVLRKHLIGDVLKFSFGGDVREKPPATQPAGEVFDVINSTLMEYLEIAGENRGTIGRGGFYRLAWRDEIDDSPQFARVYFPLNYDPERKYPLVVYLHGYNRRNPDYAADQSGVCHNIWAERHDVIYMRPLGRGNAGYRGIGEADVMHAVRLAKETFNIDENRVYLTGQSMGGGGAWYIGTRHTGVFAAVAPVFGGWDYHVDLKDEEFAKLSPQQVKFREAESSFAQAESLLNTPIFVLHGDSDMSVNVENSRYAVRMLQRWDYDVRYCEVPGKGHENLGMDDEIIEWFLRHRLERNPRCVRVRSAFLDGAEAHWVRIERQEDPMGMMIVEAKVEENNTIRIDSENVLQLRLAPPRGLINPSKPVRIIWNDELIKDVNVSPSGEMTLCAKGYIPSPLAKRPLGPTPFAYVVGTTSKDPRMKKFIEVLAERARRRWKAWQHVEPRFFKDTEITDEQVRSYSLTLFGGPEENAVAARFAKDILLEIRPDGFVIDGRDFAAKDAALRLVFRHPLNPNRTVTIIAGNSADGVFFADRLPDNSDYVIDDGKVAKEDEEIKAALAWGNFDCNWRFNEKYLNFGDPAYRSAAIVRKAPKYLTAAVADRQLMLSDLLESSSAASFDIMTRDYNWQGKPITLGGKTYSKGIAVMKWDEVCKASYDLTGGNWKRLKATIGIEVDKKPEEITPADHRSTKPLFIVRGDGKELYRSPAIGIDSLPLDINVDVTGVKMLELEVDREVRGRSAASSLDWADLRLEK